MAACFRRIAETDRGSIEMTVDGRPVQALKGDSVLVALMTSIGRVRTSEFGDGARAGFCMMGACQDCWVWTAAGDRLRSCSTPATDGMRIVTEHPIELWSDKP